MCNMELLRCQIGNLSVLDIKKLLIKRRSQAEVLNQTEYYCEVTQRSIQLKNKSFMRYFRMPYVFEDFVLHDNKNYAALTVATYCYDGGVYKLYERVDDYRYYYLEYVREKCALDVLSSCYNIVVCPDFSFHGVQKSYYLTRQANCLFNVLQYVNSLLVANYRAKNVLNHLVCVFSQLINILAGFHRAFLTFGGDFSSLVFKNGVMKVDLFLLHNQVPKTLDEGICMDFHAFKRLLMDCREVFIGARDIVFSQDVNYVLSFINQALQNAECSGADENADSQLFGVYARHTAEIIANLPFFSTPRYLHFLSRELPMQQTFAALIEPLVAPYVLQIDYERSSCARSQPLQQAELSWQTPSVNVRCPRSALRFYGKRLQTADFLLESDLAASQLLSVSRDAEAQIRREFFSSQSRPLRPQIPRAKSVGSTEITLLGEKRAKSTHRDRKFLVSANSKPKAAVFVRLQKQGEKRVQHMNQVPELIISVPAVPDTDKRERSRRTGESRCQIRDFIRQTMY